MVSILTYQPHHQAIFKKINLEWLDRYKLTESHDLMVLNDPQATIIDRGGHLWLAESDGEIVGSAALMKEHDGVYELAKMCVTESFRGKGVATLLINQCIQKAKELQAKKLLLFSNHQLVAALKLYEKHGFRNVVVENSPFATADVKMELILT
ncbi:MAG: GNAT family N-acetyltransferase [Bacteroidetes bacterium]|nr:GNAT family N-acetyltransferase [Bacteroidota bacterium]